MKDVREENEQPHMEVKIKNGKCSELVNKGAFYLPILYTGSDVVQDIMKA